jgi:hypothetical protein
LTNSEIFKAVIRVSDEQKQIQRDIEYLTRFIVYRYVDYDGKLDVEEYIDEGIIKIAENNIFDAGAEHNLLTTFQLLYDSLGENALRQYSDEEGRFRGRVDLNA